jgi:hypothetical protein
LCQENHLIPEAVGALFEISVAMGMARAVCRVVGVLGEYFSFQRDLYAIVAEIAASLEHALRFRKMTSDLKIWSETELVSLVTG